MTKDQIVKIRNLFHDKDIKVAVFGDNAIVIDETLDVVIWDDENELLYSIARTKTTSPTDYPDPSKVAYFTILGYDIVQYIQASTDYDVLKDITTEMPIEDSRKENILKWFIDTIPNRIIAKPGTRTLKTIAKEDPELYDKVFGEGEAGKLYPKEEETSKA